MRWSGASRLTLNGRSCIDRRGVYRQPLRTGHFLLTLEQTLRESLSIRHVDLEEDVLSGRTGVPVSPPGGGPLLQPHLDGPRLTGQGSLSQHRFDPVRELLFGRFHLIEQILALGQHRTHRSRVQPDSTGGTAASFTGTQLAQVALEQVGFSVEAGHADSLP